jgi:Rrf2 family protein
MQGIGRHTDYASRIVLHLASLGDGAQVPVKEIAEKRLLPAPFVRRVVARLAAAGLLNTTRGNGGGVRLSRPAAEISLLDVVRAMEGKVVLNRCVDSPHACPLAAACPVTRAWTDATRTVEGHLAGVTFAGLVAAIAREAAAAPALATSRTPASRRRRT